MAALQHASTVSTSSVCHHHKHAACFELRRTCRARAGKCTTARATLSANALGIQFNLPYRVSFGQQLALVGSSELLGNWDVDRRVTMEWNEGDVWQAEVEASQDLEALEYKYVVVERDGHISCWKPGENVRLTLQQIAAEAIAVRDAWDGSVHEVSPQVGLANNTRHQDAARAQMNEDNKAVASALQRAYGELEATLRQSMEMVQQSIDPSDPQLLINDQKLAAVSRRAISLSKALEAGAPPPAYILKDIEAKENL